MDFKQIQELIKIVNKSNIGELSIEDKGFKITIKQKEDAVQQVMAAPQPVYSQLHQPMAPQPATPQPQASG
ncbi:MAG TPA: acetyl-CoA carboxylase, biotin carboxyl carrier protein, partial [Chitinophagaceae bacterium]